MVATEHQSLVDGAVEVLLRTLQTDVREQLRILLSRCPDDDNAELRLEGSICVPGTNEGGPSDRIELVGLGLLRTDEPLLCLYMNSVLSMQTNCRRRFGNYVKPRRTISPCIKMSESLVHHESRTAS